MHAALCEQVAVYNFEKDVIITRKGNRVNLELLKVTLVEFQVLNGKPQIVDSSHLTHKQVQVFN